MVYAEKKTLYEINTESFASRYATVLVADLLGSREAVSKDHHHQIWMCGRSHYACTNAAVFVY